MHAPEPSLPLAAPSSPPHSGKRVYACGECGKTFSTSGHMTRHTRVHTGEKNHICPYPTCQRRCSRRDNLLQHFTMHLTKEERESGSSYVRQALAMMQAKAGTSAESLSAGSPSPPLSHQSSPVRSPDSPHFIFSHAVPLNASLSGSPSINDGPYAAAQRHHYHHLHQREREISPPTSYPQRRHTRKPSIHRTESSSTYSSASEASSPGVATPSGSGAIKTGCYEVSNVRGSRE